MLAIFNLKETDMRSYIPNPARLATMIASLFALNNAKLATPEQIDKAVSAIRLENVNNNPNRGVGPWVARSAGWRQRQRRKLARRTA